MCMIDVKIGKQCQPKTRTVAIGVTYAEIVDLDPERLQVTFAPHHALTYFITFNDPAPSAIMARMTPDSPPLTFNFRDHPGIPQGPFYAKSSTTADTVQVLESSLVNTEGLEE